MKVNVNGTLVDIELKLGINNNKPTGWTYEIIEEIAKKRDENGNFIISLEDYKLIRDIEKELKRNNQFSFKFDKFLNLKELHDKIIEENNELFKNAKINFKVNDKVKVNWPGWKGKSCYIYNIENGFYFVIPDDNPLRMIRVTEEYLTKI